MVTRVEISRIAEALRSARDERGLAIEQAASGAGIPLRYARLLEGDAGAGVGISDELYLVPFFRRYASFVGLNPEQLLPDFLGHVQELPGTGAPPPPLSYPSRLASVRKLVVAGAAVAAAVLLMARQSPERRSVLDDSWDEPAARATTAPVAMAAKPEGDVAVAAAPEAAPAAQAAAQATPELPPGSSPRPTPAHAAASPLQDGHATMPSVADGAAGGRELRVVAVEETWFSLAIDGGPPKEFLMRPGEGRTWNAHESFTLTVGNAGGITLTLDGRELPRLGGSGQVVRNLRLPEGGA